VSLIGVSNHELAKRRNLGLVVDDDDDDDEDLGDEGGDLDDDLCREVDGDDGYGDDDEDLHQTAEAARAGHR